MGQFEKLGRVWCSMDNKLFVMQVLSGRPEAEMDFYAYEELRDVIIMCRLVE